MTTIHQIAGVASNDSGRVHPSETSARPLFPFKARGLIARILSFFRKPEPTLFERAIAEVNRREAEARRKHRRVRIYQAMRRELVRRNLSGELR